VSDQVQLATPERVSVELPIAGLGSRAMAYLVDVALMGAVALVVYFGVSFFIPELANTVIALSSMVKTLAVAATALGLWLYWTAFEVAWGGQSPGKRLVGIRVVKLDGSPVTLFLSAVRNLLRIIDFLPACYPVGLLTMLVDRKHRRLGDLLAGTVLVRDEKVSLAAYDALAGAATAGVEVNVLEIASQYLARFAQLEPPARGRVGRQLATKLGLTVADDANDEQLRAQIAAKVGGT